ncbi:MAG: hypothetical protein HYT79_08180 [Elusimicrobia bacterium]|nr:hypothetical protein [Elusimicrobiota bacterium]
MRLSVVFAACVFVQTATASAQARALREAGHFGVILGAPTGMTIDFHADRANRIFVDAGAWSDDLSVNAGWQHRFPGLATLKDQRVSLASHLGAAVHFRFDKKTVFGVGPVLAQELVIQDSPFSFFVRLIPLIRMAPSVGYNLSFTAGAVFSF